MKENKKKQKFFYHGKFYYDEKSFWKAVKKFSTDPLTEEGFNWVVKGLIPAIWANLEMNDCIPKGKDWNGWMEKFFFDTLEKFLKEKKEK